MGAGGGMGYGQAVAAVGGILNTVAAAKEQEAMFRAYRDELKRQGVYQQQATGVQEKNVKATGAEGTKANLAQGAQERQAGYQSIAPIPLSIVGTPENSLQSARDQAALNMAGQQRAALGAYGDAAHQTGLANQDAQREMARIGNFSQGTASVYPYRLYDAQNSAWKWQLAGHILQSIGSMNPDRTAMYQQWNSALPNMYGQQPGNPNLYQYTNPEMYWGQGVPFNYSALKGVTEGPNQGTGEGWIQG